MSMLITIIVSGCLMASACILPFSRWEVFVSGQNLYSTDRLLFALIVIYCIAAIVITEINHPHKRIFYMILALFPLLLIYLAVTRTASIKGELSDGTAVPLLREYGFYVVMVILAISSLWNVISAFRVGYQKD